MQLSKNFTLSEFLKTDYAVSLNPSDKQTKNLKILCQTILQPIRNAFCHPMKINSGFRSKELNEMIPGSSKTSQHLKGEASDWRFFNISSEANSLMLWDAFCWTYWNRMYGQQIIYLDTTGNRITYKFIHISLGSKKETLANFNGKNYNIEKLLNY